MSKELIEKIERLKKERNAVILAHNYQTGDVQDIADFAGDSLGLSIQAANTGADVIVFCGVLFMAETAVILSPDKTVLLPEIQAGCPMAEMITAEQVLELKEKHPGAVVVCYVNSTAEVKAVSDYCCTSGNAVELVNTIDQAKQIIFVPDQHLGQHVKEKTGRDVILWPGYCQVHVRITADNVQRTRQTYPEAIVMAHPECTEQVKACADQLLSTGQMLSFAKTSDDKQFIVATEEGIIHTLKKQNPDKEFYCATDKAVCVNMKKITLEKIAWALEDMKYKITVDPEVSKKAKAALDRMIEVVPSK